MAKWIVNGDGEMVCSECGTELPYIISQRATWDKPFERKDYIDPTPYCPHCGKIMENHEE